MTSLTEATIRANSIVYPLLTDSGVYQEGEGYERVAIVNHINPALPRQMVKFEVRVDRVPGRSYANTHVWSSANQAWQVVAMLDHREFWDDMPGYLRWANDTSDNKTAGLLARMVADIVALIESGEVDL